MEEKISISFVDLEDLLYERSEFYKKYYNRIIEKLEKENEFLKDKIRIIEFEQDNKWKAEDFIKKIKEKK